MSVPTALTAPPAVKQPDPVVPDAAEGTTARRVSEEAHKPGAETETTTTEQQQQQQPAAEQVTAAPAPAPAATPSGSA